MPCSRSLRSIRGGSSPTPICCEPSGDRRRKDRSIISASPFARLRQKLERNPSEPELIVNEPAVGYRLKVG